MNTGLSKCGYISQALCYLDRGRSQGDEQCGGEGEGGGVQGVVADMAIVHLRTKEKNN